ncbi:L-fucose/L-arabinose isomerase family protein [Carboxydichorda subterranea]|uniref:L-fucose/L-arabinose isomerase family protein n=1 Tax=Carboxydichorda subterranea TaxID=3109565 RepID=UPI003857D714
MQNRPKLGILTFSDGRRYAHERLIEENKAFERRLRGALEGAGVEVVTGELVWTNQLAAQEARRLAREGCEATIFHYAIWAFPQFTALAARFAPRPILLFGPINPSRPGMVSVLAAAGALDQMGVRYRRVFGEIEEAEVLRRVVAWARGAHAAYRLQGETFGLFGGRPIGINTATAPVDQWVSQFGIDVEHVDQWEVVRRSQAFIGTDRVRHARQWLEEHVRKVHYDGQQLTPEKLELQIASYHALRDIIDERGFDFIGIKSQPELTEHFVTTDVPEAFLNDPYDWEGPHDPIVCATEADMDAALTMEVFKHVAGTPVLFADVRHYFADLGIFDLVNSGQHATYFAGRSFEPEHNLPRVELKPQGFYFPAGGASVFHVAAPGDVTLARLTREKGEYRMHIVRGEFVRLGPEDEARRIALVQDNWPHAFVRLRVPAERFLAEFPCNHVHGVYGNVVAELLEWCEITGTRPILLGDGDVPGSPITDTRQQKGGRP